MVQRSALSALKQVKLGLLTACYIAWSSSMHCLMERQEGVPKVVMVLRLRLTARGAAGFFAFVGICLKATTSIARPSIQLSSIGRIPSGRGLPAGFGYSAMQNDAVLDTFHQGSRTLAFIVCEEATPLHFAADRCHSCNAACTAHNNA